MHNADILGRLVYGSNMIESAGNSLNITTKLCKAVFAGQAVTAHLNKEDDEAYYQEHVNHLRASRRPTHHADVIQSRLEIIQHAQAVQHTIHHIVTHKEPWSEALILEAHRILHTGLDSDVSAGQYRTYEVAVKYEKPGERQKKGHLCMRARAVPGYIKDMVEHLNRETAEAERKEPGSVDAYVLAARYHHLFVNIHPFGDGNGRISRIILNTLLLRYAGCVSVFGGVERERDEYIGIATRASRMFHAEDGEVEFERQKGHLELGDFVRDKAEVV